MAPAVGDRYVITSANFHSDGLNVNGLVDLFVPAHVYR